MGITEPDYAERVRALLRLYGYSLEAPGVDPEVILEAMKSDKKKRRRQIRLVLQRSLCSTEVVPVDEALVREVLSA